MNEEKLGFDELEEERIEHKVQTLLDVVAQISAVLEEENRALQAHDLSAAKEMVAQKTALSRSYNEIFKFFKSNPNVLKNADKGRNGEIKQALTNLQNFMNKNAELLRVNMEANGRIIKLIVDSAQNQRAEQSSIYNAGAYLRDVSGKTNAVSFNAVL